MGQREAGCEVDDQIGVGWANSHSLTELPVCQKGSIQIVGVLPNQVLGCLNSTLSLTVALCKLWRRSAMIETRLTGELCKLGCRKLEAVV